MEASRLYADAVSKESAEIRDFIQLYALLTEIRLIATRPVIDASMQVMDRIIEAFHQPNRALDDWLDATKRGQLDVLLVFGEACRAELFPTAR